MLKQQGLGEKGGIKDPAATAFEPRGLLLLG